MRRRPLKMSIENMCAMLTKRMRNSDLMTVKLSYNEAFYLSVVLGDCRFMATMVAAELETLQKRSWFKRWLHGIVNSLP